MQERSVRVVRAGTKSARLRVEQDEVVLYVPFHTAEETVKAILRRHRRWIANRQAQLTQMQSTARERPPFAPEELEKLRQDARRVIAARVAYYAPLVGVYCPRITIRFQKTRWGSCSAKGNLSFNGLLLLAPEGTLDAVVVHELCHLRRMDHSPQFYGEVLRVMPDYKEHHDWLKRHGRELLSRLPK